MNDYNPHVSSIELTENIERYYDSIINSQEFADKNLENFVIRNDDDQVAKDYIQSFFNGGNHFKNGEAISIVGSKGSGKTHLLVAIRKIITDRGLRCPLLNCVDICKRLTRANRLSKVKKEIDDEFALIDKLALLEILMIDDFPRGMKDANRIGFGEIDFPMLLYDLFNQRYLSKRPTFITSNFTYEDLAKKFGENDYGDFIVDRIQGRNGKYLWLSADSFRSENLN